jgi:hypothetical protein
MTDSTLATNSLGNSSSVQGTGPVDFVDPVMGIMKRKKGKPLRSILQNATNKEMANDLKKDRRRGI